MKRRWGAIAALLLVVSLAGCVLEDLYPTPSPTATPAPSPTEPTPTPTPPTDVVVSSTVTHEFGTPVQGEPFLTEHTVTIPILPPPAPPLPCLTLVEAGRHPAESPAFDQVSFRFTGTFPSYEIAYVPSLSAIATGDEVPLPGALATLRVEFTHAQAHQEDGASCTESVPPTPVGFPAVQTTALAGDQDGVVRYGIGTGDGTNAADGRGSVRVVEVERIEAGQHLFVIAVQIATTTTEE
jgi:hypothetical protein